MDVIRKGILILLICSINYARIDCADETDQISGYSADRSNYNYINDMDEQNDNMDSLLNDGTLIKRGPVGFLGMRGKKVPELNADDDSIRADLFEVAPSEKKYYMKYPVKYPTDVKRAPTGGFMGMRGKKDEMYVLKKFDSKRGAYNGRQMLNRMPTDSTESFDLHQVRFRAKKLPTTAGFFGMRGKKGPNQFRGKFVGVRGKKISEPQYDNLREALMGLQTELNEDAMYKRAPNGFVGMRGKKAFE